MPSARTRQRSRGQQRSRGRGRSRSMRGGDPYMTCYNGYIADGETPANADRMCSSLIND